MAVRSRWRDPRLTVMVVCTAAALAVTFLGRPAFADGASTVSGTVFSDVDGDGTQDVDEPPRAGVPLWVVGEKASISITTDASGAFAAPVDQLGSGPYGVLIGNPIDSAGAPTDPSRAVGVTLPDGLGYSARGTANIGPWVWPVQAGESHSYGVSSCAPSEPCGGVQFGDQVWRDSDGDGLQDPSEPPIAGAQVRLLAGDRVVASTTTDAAGRWLVTDASLSVGAGVPVADLRAAGVTTVEITVPASTEPGMAWEATTAGAPFDLVNSDAIASGENTARIAVPAGGSGLSFDAGFRPVAQQTQLASATTAAPETTAAPTPTTAAPEPTEPAPTTAAPAVPAPAVTGGRGGGQGPSTPAFVEPSGGGDLPGTKQPPALFPSTAVSAATSATATAANTPVALADTREPSNPEARSAVIATPTAEDQKLITAGTGADAGKPVDSGTEVLGARALPSPVAGGEDGLEPGTAVGSGTPEQLTPLPNLSGPRFGGPAIDGGTLPRTGSRTSTYAGLALMLLGMGACLVMTAAQGRKDEGFGSLFS